MKCHCGRDLHYSDKKLEQTITDLCTQLGDYMLVKTGTGPTYWVQRHYIALHGIKGMDLAILGFKEASADQIKRGR